MWKSFKRIYFQIQSNVQQKGMIKRKSYYVSITEGFCTVSEINILTSLSLTSLSRSKRTAIKHRFTLFQRGDAAILNDLFVLLAFLIRNGFKFFPSLSCLSEHGLNPYSFYICIIHNWHRPNWFHRGGRIWTTSEQLHFNHV